MNRDLKLILIGGRLVALGLVLGASLFRGSPAEAQQRPYRECAFGRQETHDIDGNGIWERQDREFQGDRRIQVPHGWEGVGGGGFAGRGRILICRR